MHMHGNAHTHMHAHAPFGTRSSRCHLQLSRRVSLGTARRLPAEPWGARGQGWRWGQGAPLTAAALCRLLVAGLQPEAPNALARKGAGSWEEEPTALPTPDEPAAEARFVTTAPPLDLLNHHPLLEDFLRDAPRPGPFLGGAQRPDPPDPPEPLAPTPAPSLARPDEPPAFPEPSTPSAPTALMGNRAEAGDVEGTPEMARPVFTTELLATAAGPVVPWPEPRAAVPGPVRTEPLVTPAPTFSPTGLPRPGPVTVTSSPPSASSPPALVAPPQVPGPTLPQAVEPQTAVTPSATASGDDEDTTSTTLITTTTITTGPAPGESPCQLGCGV